MSWIRIANTESFPAREGRSVDLGDREIAVFNLGERFAAIDAACPHRGGPLCDGIVTGVGAPSLAGGKIERNCAGDHAVVCPLHGWKVNLENGKVLKPEVSVRVDTYDIRINGGIIEVNVPSVAEEEIAA